MCRTLAGYANFEKEQLVRERRSMTHKELMQKLDEVIAEAERTRLFGTIEIEMRSGLATVLRTLKTERLGENPNGKPPYC